MHSPTSTPPLYRIRFRKRGRLNWSWDEKLPTSFNQAQSALVELARNNSEEYEFDLVTIQD